MCFGDEKSSGCRVAATRPPPRAPLRRSAVVRKPASGSRSSPADSSSTPRAPPANRGAPQSMRSRTVRFGAAHQRLDAAVAAVARQPARPSASACSAATSGSRPLTPGRG